VDHLLVFRQRHRAGAFQRPLHVVAGDAVRLSTGLTPLLLRVPMWLPAMPT
jgi:hypothetical protein